MDILQFYGQGWLSYYQPIQAMTLKIRFNETLSFIYKEFGKDFDLFKEFLRYL